VKPIVTIGAGAIGALLGGHLSERFDDVVLADEWTAHVSAICGHGLEIGGVRGERRFHPRAIELERLTSEVAEASLVFVCVKSTDTARMIETCTPLVGEATAVVSVQNGMNDELLAEAFGPERTVAAVCEVGGYLEGPGRMIETRAQGAFVIGALDGRITGRIHEVARVMDACAPTTASRNVVGLRWSKLIWNCMMNPVSALSGLGQGEIILGEPTRHLCLALGAEGVAVSLAAGAELEPLTSMGIDPRSFSASRAARREVEESLVARYASQLGKSTSMSQDIARGRPTEIDHLNGYVVERGRRLGVDTPINSRVVELVHRLEDRDLRAGPSAIAPLLEVGAQV
jgi:2-dehydropantoate 2-reductase